jgi:transposase
MAGKSKRSKLVLVPEEVKELQQLAQSRTAPLREVQRARILCRYHAGETITEIARALRMTRHSVGKWIARGLALGVKAALKDTYHRPRPPVITEEAKAWVVHLACSKPKEMGYAAELWTRKSLAQHVRQRAAEAGHPSLVRAAKATVQRILAAQPLHPEKVTYYLEHRDPHFEAKMREVLLVYQEVALQNGTPSPEGVPPQVVTVSVDEKPGLQALAKHSGGFAPRAGEAPHRGPRSRIPTLGHFLHLGRAGPAQWPRDGAGGAPSPQSGVHRLAQGPG